MSPPPKRFYDLLYIFDATDESSSIQSTQHDNDPDVYQVGISDSDDLWNTLKRMVEAGMTFRNVVLETHGRPGVIAINDKSIVGGEFAVNSAGVGYERLFPMFGKLYFPGCDCADSDAGWDFLERVGAVFFKMAGGVVVGWTSAGFAQVFASLPYFGHTLHFTGETRTIIFGPGGTELSRSSSSDSAHLTDFAPVDG